MPRRAAPVAPIVHKVDSKMRTRASKALAKAIETGAPLPEQKNYNEASNLFVSLTTFLRRTTTSSLCRT